MRLIEEATDPQILPFIEKEAQLMDYMITKMFWLHIYFVITVVLLKFLVVLFGDLCHYMT